MEVFIEPATRSKILCETGKKTPFDYIEKLCENFEDIAIEIFAELKTHLSSVALVCRRWEKLADDSRLYRKIFPFNITFSSADWKEYIGVDAGKDSRLPRCAYRDLASNENGFLLTWVPKMVKIINDVNFEGQQILTLELAGNLSANAKERKVGYDPNSWEEGLEEEQEPENPHWVLINKDVKWRNLEDMDLESAQGSVVGLRDAAISLLMRYIKWDERCFVCDSANGRMMGVKDKIEGLQILCGFTSQGFFIDNDGSYSDFDFIVSRKSF